MNSKQILMRPLLWLMACLTLGMAPFKPEPHVVEKLRWILSGADGMRAIDWFDFVMHGTPWVMLVISIVVYLRQREQIEDD